MWNCCEILNEISYLEKLCRHSAYGFFLPCLQSHHHLNTLGIILPPGSLALTVKRHHYHLSEDTALLGTQAKDGDQGKDEGHSRDRNPCGRRQEPESPIRKGSEKSPPKKETLLPPILQSHPNPFYSGPLAKSRNGRRKMTRDRYGAWARLDQGPEFKS